MAFSVATVVAATYDTTDRAAFDLYTSPGTYTIHPGRLYIAMVVGRGGVFQPGYGNTTTTSLAGSWTALAQRTAAGGSTWVSLYWYYRPVDQPALTAQSQLVAFGDAATGCAMAVIEITGAAYIPTESTGLPAVQTATDQASSSVTSLAATFAATPQHGNLIVAAGAAQVNEDTTPELANSTKANGGSPNTTAMLEWEVVQDTTPSFAWTTANAQACIAAAELGKSLFPRVALI